MTEHRVCRGKRLCDRVAAMVVLVLCCWIAVAQAQTPPHEKLVSTTTIPALGFQGKRGIGVVRTFMFPMLHPSDPARYDVDPYVPRWSAVMPAAFLKELLQTGFDFVRIAIEPGPLLDADSSTLKLRIGEITDAIDQSLAVGMKVLVDVHPRESHPRWNFRDLSEGPSNPAFRRFIEVMRALAAGLVKYDPRDVALEVFNEPPPPCHWSNGRAWPSVLKMIYDQVRSAAPRLTLFLAGACWAKIDGLLQIDASQFDRNTVFVFHFYEPHLFTHQGWWHGSKYLQYVPRLQFPPDISAMEDTIKAVVRRIEAAPDIADNEKGKEIWDATVDLQHYFKIKEWSKYISERFDEVARWADRNGIDRNRIVLGEFGVLGDVWGKTGAAPEDRANWLATVRMAAERRGFRWSAWSLTNTMGIVKGDVDGPLDVEILKALGLQAP